MMQDTEITKSNNQETTIVESSTGSDNDNNPSNGSGTINGSNSTTSTRIGNSSSSSTNGTNSQHRSISIEPIPTTGDDDNFNDNDSVISNPMDSNRHSLPTVDEYIVSTSGTSGSNTRSRTRRRRGGIALLFLMITCTIIAAVAAVVIALSMGKSSNNNNNPNQSQEDEKQDDNSNLGPDFGNGPIDLEERAKLTLEYIKSITLNPIAFNNHHSPEYLATKWIATKDPFFLDIPKIGSDPSSHDNNDIRYHQRYALAVLYYATSGVKDDDTNNKGWIHDFQFLLGNHECDWNDRYNSQYLPDDFIKDHPNIVYGVYCSDGNYDNNNGIRRRHNRRDRQQRELRGGQRGSSSNLKNKVSSIVLPKNNLKGQLPDDIGLLTNLHTLVLTGNDIKGVLPNGLQYATNLRTLWLNRNMIVGQIPKWIGTSFQQLKNFDIRDNGLTGCISTTDFSSSLINNLETLALKDNNFDCNLSDTGIEKLTNLKNLILSNNVFRGTIPSSFGTSLTNLRNLQLSNNMLMGTVPDTFINLDKLINLQLEVNKGVNVDVIYNDKPDIGLIGENIISIVNELPNLEVLILKNNSFTGMIDNDDDEEEEFLDKSYYKIRIIDLSSNRFFGNIPSSLFKRLRLETLDLSNNKFGSGGTVNHLPDDIPAGNDIMKFLALQNNVLENTIPESIGNLVALTHLDISGNRIGGFNMQSTIGQLSNLRVLSLANNKQIGQGEESIPTFFGNLQSLQELSLRNTGRISSIPEWIGEKLSNLIYLDLSSNKLNTNIPTTIGLLTGLRTLLLNNNMLQENVPKEFMSLTNLRLLRIENNNLEGSFNNGGIEEDGPMICHSKEVSHALMKLQFIYADCNELIECECCTKCCDVIIDDEISNNCNTAEDYHMETKLNYHQTTIFDRDDIVFDQDLNDLNLD